MPAKRPVAVSLLLSCALALGACKRGDTETRPPDPATRRLTRSGEVIGFQGQYGSHVWLGLPFAQPPVGERRWRAPAPPQSWTGSREAVQYGSSCPQFASTFGGVSGARPGTPVGSEDCLYLNVYAPRFSASALPAGAQRLPVMVWIHGGGNTIGEGAFYNGGNLAVTHNVIVITVNYRLGPFGWFRHPALRGQGTSDDERSGNFGTLDLIRALEWVRENAEAFGGDPGNVTIFGESAGGVNVYSLLLSPRARGLFHRAVVQSGGLHLRQVAEAEHFSDDAAPGDPNSSNEMLLRLLLAEKRAPDRAAAKSQLAAMSKAEVEAYLRGKTQRAILTAYTPMPGVGMISMPLVFRDGAVLPQEEPLPQLGRSGGYNPVPVMIGTNRDENKLFLFPDRTRVRRWLWLFYRLRDERWYNLSAEYLSKMWKATGADEPAAALAALPGQSVFVYRFDWDEEPALFGADLSTMLGAAHGFEIPFVFGHFDLGRAANMIFSEDNEPGRRALSSQMMSYWAQFAYTGAPGRGRDGELPEWPAWGASNPTTPKFIVFDTPAGGGLRMSSDTVTRASVLAAVDGDSRLSTPRQRCMIFRELANWSRGLSKNDYPNAGRSGCAEYPFDTYPWPE
ncbi:MAG: carboxylesterase family protein [Deltaproteobacteria bacterium]|nr:carboxylesterase family protein [Deltaproteobacteria bacterium]